MNNYLLYVTFFAGSDDLEDIDNGMYILSIDKEISKEEMKGLFRQVNRLLDTYAQENGEVEFPISYELGLNIHTLMDGLKILTKGEVKEIKSDCGKELLTNLTNYYEIEQWQ